MDKQDKKSSVLFYADWADPLRSLPLEEAGKLFLGILDYVRTGVPPAFDSPGTAMAWQFIRMRLDDNLEKWDATREKRRQAGAIGGRLSQAVQASNRQEAARSGEASALAAKQIQANQANASFAKQTQAKQAVPAPVLVPEPVPVLGKTSSSSVQGEPDRTTTTRPTEKGCSDAAGEAPAYPAEAGKPEAFWKSCGYPNEEAAFQAFAFYRQAGMEDALIVQAVREAEARKAKNPLAYTRQILEEALGSGQYTLTAWQARKRPAGGSGAGSGKRVDRDTPSGNDFLADALTRPRRHKRKNE